MNSSLGRRLSVAALLASVLALVGNAAFADSVLRPLTTDRPDLTESPFTVNAGHVQVESTLVGYSKSRTDGDGIHEDAFEFATTNVRVGLTERSELNVAWQPFGIVTRHQRGGAQDLRDDGVGSLQISAKINLFGNDRFEKVGDTALAVLPFVTIP
ncbi:MAG: transporter, partial [Alphaproteobacteria bacterium]|nr:transporter [Alphaproteobacteria bacterium]